MECRQSNISLVSQATPSTPQHGTARMPVMQYIRCCGVEGVACETNKQQSENFLAGVEQHHVPEKCSLYPFRDRGI